MRQQLCAASGTKSLLLGGCVAIVRVGWMLIACADVHVLHIAVHGAQCADTNDVGCSLQHMYENIAGLWCNGW
jgi:hypothetical protein